jgi:hypothetical protein
VASQTAHRQPRRVLLLARQPFPTAAQRRLLASDRDVLLDQRLVPQAVGGDAQALRGDAELPQHVAEPHHVLLEIAVRVAGMRVVVPVGHLLRAGDGLPAARRVHRHEARSAALSALAHPHVLFALLLGQRQAGVGEVHHALVGPEHDRLALTQAEGADQPQHAAHVGIEGGHLIDQAIDIHALRRPALVALVDAAALVLGQLQPVVRRRADEARFAEPAGQAAQEA